MKYLIVFLALCSTAMAQNLPPAVQQALDNAVGAASGANMLKEDAKVSGAEARAWIIEAEEKYYDWLFNGGELIPFVETAIADAKAKCALADDDYGAKLERDAQGHIVIYDSTLTNVLQPPYPPDARPKLIIVPGGGYEKYVQGATFIKTGKVTDLVKAEVKFTASQQHFIDADANFDAAFADAQAAWQEVENWEYYGGMYP